MNLRPALSAPLPWLTFFGGRISGKTPGKRPAFFIFPRTLKVTKEGKRFIGILFVIGLAAINTGNNLLYLVVAMLLSLIIISGIMSEATIKKLRVKRELAPRIYKNTPAAARLEIENTKKYLPSYSFRIEEFPVEAVKTEPAYVLKLPGGGKTIRTFRYVFEKRGVFKLYGLNFTTRFPFGLFIKGRPEKMEQEVLVYPSVRKIKEPGIYGGANSGSSSLQKKGHGSQIHGLRDYTIQDDSRYIHWKASARTGKLLRKEFEKEKERRVAIVFDNLRCEQQLFEEMVDTAASLCSHFITMGYGVGLKTLSGEVAVSYGIANLERMLYNLALIKPVEKTGMPSVKTVFLD